jgi:replication factor C small subunit
MPPSLWCEKYRPSTLDDFVWCDLEMRATVEQWLADGALPHCLFSGVQGTGKTSLSKLLMKSLQIPATDVLYINASRERQIDAFQSRVVNFIESWAMGPSGVKYILLDEADKMSPVAQGFLRNEMETYVDICRFVMTANYPKRILPAIHSRIQQLHFPSLNSNEFILRLAHILDGENITFDEQVLISYKVATYPDLRKCINLAQQNSHDGKLGVIRPMETGTPDYLLTMIDLFRKGRYLDARKLIIEQIQLDEYDDCYRTLYQHLALFGSTQDQQDEILLVIRKAAINHQMAADPEINLSACMAEISQVMKSYAVTQ